MSFNLTETFPTLGNAPITEAIIDIRCELPADVPLERLADFAQGIEDRFSEPIKRQRIEARIEFHPGAAPKLASPGAAPDGYLFRSEKEHLVAQARLDGFTLSRLRPYHSGDKFVEQARELWEQYIRAARPTKVTRLAIRNVNRIEVDPGADLQRYLLTGPEIARALPQQMLGFFMRVVIPDPSGAVAIINETLGQPAPGASTMPLIFDVDAFRETALQPGDPEIWNTLGVLRILKNRIFFRSLTAETLEAFR